ncbi:MULTISPECIES: hypothetical protein [unclassified Microbacterium]|uniref:hypothetical protein n=1 Tax=unclassified Microbacterium TaxID=2609290 RepID=UPI00109D43C7|nr:MULTISPECIES: hypothetical protein [unclassified Microbacterium]
MDVSATRRGVPAVALWGAVGALAWATLTVLLGGGSAHADEQQDGPLDGLTSLVNETVSTVTAPVAPVVSKVVAPVVTKVVAPVQKAVPAVVETVTQAVAETPVVGPATAPVVHAVTETAEAVIAPVTEVLTDSPVSQITDPILDTVAGVPVVGDLVTDLGVISAVDDVVGVVDDTTALLGEVTNGTVPPVLEALDPTTPDPTTPVPTPGTGVIDHSDDVVPGIAVTATAAAPAPILGASGVASAHATALSSSPGVSLAGSQSAPAAQDTATAPTGSSSGNPPGAPAPASSSAGPGGGSSPAHARLSDVAPAPLRAGERTSGASDDVLPSSPVADTDVSPD